MAESQVKVSLPGAIALRLDAAVAAGEFASRDELVATVLAEWAASGIKLPDTETLRRLWDEGIASGAGGDAEKFFAAMRERFPVAQ